MSLYIFDAQYAPVYLQLLSEVYVNKDGNV